MTVTLTLPQTDTRHVAGTEWSVQSLADSLRREAKLLLDLKEVLQRQRAAVAKDDLALVDETVYSAQRIFRTLAEARRQRRALLEILGVSPDAGLDDLGAYLGVRMTMDLRLAQTELKEAARRVSGELAVNKKILEGAIASGDALIRGLRGGSDKSTGVYGPQADIEPSAGDGGLIINRQV
jgi:flagellar biosynthesis/type III secretory pathway chaperone